jgi:hypothetical protein
VKTLLESEKLNYIKMFFENHHGMNDLYAETVLKYFLNLFIENALVEK